LEKKGPVLPRSKKKRTDPREKQKVCVLRGTTNWLGGDNLSDFWLEKVCSTASGQFHFSNTTSNTRLASRRKKHVCGEEKPNAMARPPLFSLGFKIVTICLATIPTFLIVVYLAHRFFPFSLGKSFAKPPSL